MHSHTEIIGICTSVQWYFWSFNEEIFRRGKDTQNHITSLGVYKSLLLPLHYCSFSTGDPAVMVDNKTTWKWNQPEGGLMGCWGDSVGVAGARSESRLLIPEPSGSDVHDCQDRAPAKQRQAGYDKTNKSRNLPVSVTLPAGKQIAATHSSYA